MLDLMFSLLYDRDMNKSSVITKECAVGLFKTQAALAKALDISKGAVSQWKDGMPIPEVHALKIRYELKPESFADESAA